MSIERKEYKDAETTELLNQIYGIGKWSGLNAPEKRECWQYGYDNPTVRTGKFSNSDTDKERFHPLMLGGNKNITDDKLDAYYICLGQFAPRLCLRCGHTWLSDKIPQTCPNPDCRSPYWNKPRQK